MTHRPVHHSPSHARQRRVRLAWLALVPALTAMALESDRDQDVIYSSSGNSTSRVVDDTRIITIEGDVKVTQGTLEITGDRAVFERPLESDAITRITITGTPATYRQQLDEDGTEVLGDAETIYFYEEAAESVIELVGAAHLRQSNDALSCVSIKYFTDSGITHYTGPCSGILSRPAE